ncbi:MAG: MlaD family protein [Gemmatimonadales bacterium]
MEQRYALYLRVANAEGLNQDTRVMLQGLAIGRVRQVNPRLDPVKNSLEFVAELSMLEKFPDGSLLRLPRGTRAEITQPTGFVGATIVQLIMPQGPDTTPARPELLQPGDTIETTRVANVLDLMGDVAGRLTEEVTVTLEETRELMERTTTTIERSNRVLASSGPQIGKVLSLLADNLARTDRMLAAFEPQVGEATETLMATLADTRQVLQHLDTLVATAQNMADENRPAIVETIALLQRTAVILENFTDKMSRRPLRMFTGVKPPPDTVQREP